MKKQVARKGTKNVSKNGKTVTVEHSKETKVIPESELASVSFGKGMTINMGNYESVRLDVRVTLPCRANKTDVENAISNAQVVVIQELDKQMKLLDVKGSEVDDGIIL